MRPQISGSGSCTTRLQLLFFGWERSWATVSFVWNTLPVKEVFFPIVEVNTLSTQHIQTPKSSGPCLCKRWRQLLFVRLSKGMTKSKYVLCLKYLIYEEVIFPNHWSEYFEHSTRTNSIKNGLPFVNQPKSTFACATSHGNEEVHLNSLFRNTSLINELFFTLKFCIYLSEL